MGVLLMLPWQGVDGDVEASGGLDTGAESAGVTCCGFVFGDSLMPWLGLSYGLG